jgi:hypothetical protein
MDWEVTPYIGMGVLRLGTSQTAMREQLGAGFSTFRKSSWSPSLTDSYDEFGLHLYYDDDDQLEFIEAFPPCQPTYHGHPPMEPNLAQVLGHLEELGQRAREELGSYTIEDIGVALYAPSPFGPKESVSVFRRGYYENRFPSGPALS